MVSVDSESTLDIELVSLTYIPSAVIDEFKPRICALSSTIIAMLAPMVSVMSII